MNEEEKEAIEYLENQDNSVNWNYPTLQAILSVLNLIDKLQKENEELKSKKQLEIDTSEEVLKWKAKYHLLSRKIDVISKEKIRKFIKEELPDDEIMGCCETYDSNGVYLRKKLEEILEE